MTMLQHHRSGLPTEWRYGAFDDLRGIHLLFFCRKELMRILHTRRKAEIEILTSCGSGCLGESKGTSCLVHYICHRILHFVEMSTV